MYKSILAKNSAKNILQTAIIKLTKLIIEYSAPVAPELATEANQNKAMNIGANIAPFHFLKKSAMFRVFR